jgi:hypothetical protein
LIPDIRSRSTQKLAKMIEVSKFHEAPNLLQSVLVSYSLVGAFLPICVVSYPFLVLRGAHVKSIPQFCHLMQSTLFGASMMCLIRVSSKNLPNVVRCGIKLRQTPAKHKFQPKFDIVGH